MHRPTVDGPNLAAKEDLGWKEKSGWSWCAGTATIR